MAEKDFKKASTLCWSCANACNNGCSWSKDLIPIDGWTTEPLTPNFIITSCPQYQEERRNRSRPDDFDNDGCLELLKAAGTALYKDYISGDGPYEKDNDDVTTIIDSMRKNRRDIERFLTSKYGRHLMMLTNPESVILELRRLADIHDASEREAVENV